MSQQKTYSSSSEKKTTSEEETDTPCTISTTTAGNLWGQSTAGQSADVKKKSVEVNTNWALPQ